ncbi:MAG: hypothetical protein V4850_04665 [Myxococcota bacterium]
MNAWTTFRLAAWRELWGRWPLHVVAPVLGALGALFPDDLLLKGFILLLLFGVVGVIASGGRVAADAFWRGLGGAGWARVAGAMAVQVPPLVVAVALLQGRTAAGILAVVYTSVLLARTLGGGLLLLFLPLGTMVVILVLWLLSLWLLFRGDGVFFGWTVAASLLAVVGALCAEQRGEGARRGPRWARWTRIGAVSVATLWIAAMGLSAVPFGAVPVSSFTPSASGAVLLLPIGKIASLYSRATLWEAGQRRSIGPRGALGGHLGPDGAAILHMSPSINAQLLVAPDGATQACVVPAPRGSLEYSWRADGRAVFVETKSGMYEIAIDTGCALLPATLGGWLGTQRVLVTDNVVRIDGVELARPGPVAKLVQSEGHVYALAGAMLYEVTAAGLDLLASLDAPSLYAVSHGVCSSGGDGFRCVRNGSREIVNHAHWPIDVNVSWDRVERRLVEPVTGRVIAALDWDGFHGEAAVSDDGTVRFALDDGLMEIDSSGGMALRAF